MTKKNVGSVFLALLLGSLSMIVQTIRECFIFKGPYYAFNAIINMSLTLFLRVLFITLMITRWVTYLRLNLIQRTSIFSFKLSFAIFTNVLSNLMMREHLSKLQRILGITTIICGATPPPISCFIH